MRLRRFFALVMAVAIRRMVASRTENVDSSWACGRSKGRLASRTTMRGESDDVGDVESVMSRQIV